MQFVFFKQLSFNYVIFFENSLFINNILKSKVRQFFIDRFKDRISLNKIFNDNFNNLSRISFIFINENIHRYNVNRIIEEFQFIDIKIIIMNVIIRYIKNNSLNQKPLGSSDSFENPKIDVINENHENRFLSNDVEFFNFFSITNSMISKQK